MATDRAKLLQAKEEWAEPSSFSLTQGEDMWQVEAVEEGVGISKDQAAMPAHAEQIRSAQQLTDEQVGQLVR